MQKVTFLLVTGKHPFALASDDVPNSNCTIIATGDQSTAFGCQCTDGVCVSFKETKMIRILINKLLELHQCQNQAIYKLRTYLTWVTVLLLHKRILWFMRLRQLPDA